MITKDFPDYFWSWKTFFFFFFFCRNLSCSLGNLEQERVCVSVLTGILYTLLKNKMILLFFLCSYLLMNLNIIFISAHLGIFPHWFIVFLIFFMVCYMHVSLSPNYKFVFPFKFLYVLFYYYYFFYYLSILVGI